MAEGRGCDPALRQSLIDHVRKLTQVGLTRNTSGNLSHRVNGGFLVTPSGMAYDDLVPEDIVFVGWDGMAHGRRLPSSEWHFHRDIMLERPEVNVVLHGHPPFATSLACLREGIPPFHYMVAAAGGSDIRCAEYATYGTPELSRNALVALADRKACLLANHGIIALGPSFAKALYVAIEVEVLAEMYWRARQIGQPIILDDAEMTRVLAKFSSYGYQPPLPDAEGS